MTTAETGFGRGGEKSLSAFCALIHVKLWAIVQHPSMHALICVEHHSLGPMHKHAVEWTDECETRHDIENINMFWAHHWKFKSCEHANLNVKSSGFEYKNKKKKKAKKKNFLS